VTEFRDARAIEAAMDRLYAHQRAPGYGQARSEFMKQLDALLPACVAPMLAVGERRLQELDDSAPDVNRIHHSLHLLFDFFEGQALAIAEARLASTVPTDEELTAQLQLSLNELRAKPR